MFFLARSAICITLVVSALPDRKTDATADLVPARLVSAMGQEALNRLCRDEPSRCLDALGRIAAVSRDTLNPADRTPRWSGPAIATAH